MRYRLLAALFSALAPFHTDPERARELRGLAAEVRGLEDLPRAQPATSR